MPVVAIGAVGVIVLALLAILIVFAAELLTKLIVNLVDRLPIVGSALGGAISSFARTVIADTKASAYAVMQPIVNFFYAIGQHLAGMWDATANFAAEVSVTMHRLYSVTLPWVIDRAYSLSVAWARAFATSLFNKAEALTRLAVRELDHAIHVVESRVVAVERVVARDISGIEHRIASVEATVVHDIAVAEVTAEDMAKALANSVRVDLTNALDLAEAQAAQTLTATVRAIDGTIQGVANEVLDLAANGDAAVLAGIDAAASTVAVAAWPVVTDIVDGIKGAVVPVEDVIKGAVDSIPAAVPVDLAGVLASTMAVATVGADFVKECGLDLCSNLGGLGRFLAGLAGDLEEGAFLALIALMIADPKAGADAARAAMETPANEVAALAHDVFG